MRIGVMLRTISEQQGIGIYTRNLVDQLLRIDPRNEYVLYYRDPEFLGRYGDRPNVRERLLPSRSKAVWDQVRVPRAASEDRVDVLFHTKFTVPFLTRIPSVMALHGASWYTNPEVYKRLDLAYVRTVMPLYCRKASAIMSNSDCTTRDFIHYLGLPPDKLHTANLAADDRFRPISDRAVLDGVRKRYTLPDRFILAVIKYDPRKNFANLIAAFENLHHTTDCKLVVVGRNCERYRDEQRLAERGLANDVLFVGWIEQDELPAIYNLADFLFFPSIIEEFGIPVCEALACGLPMVVSKVGAPPDLAGEAGIFVDPYEVKGMTQAITRLWNEPELRRAKATLALERSRLFSWQKCAETTLAVLEQVAVGRRSAAPVSSVSKLAS
jgi:glycosyltransferase involved in cell wall biosynthesis